MGELRKVDLELKDKIATDIDLAIASGDYSDLNDVIGEALSIWSASREERLAQLRALIDEGLASGDPKEVTSEWFDTVLERALAIARPAAAE